MVSFEHGKLIKQIARGDRCPEDESDFEVWRAGLGHVDMLRRNSAEHDELIVTALSPITFVHSAVLGSDHPGLGDHKGLLKWSGSLFHHSAQPFYAFVQVGELRVEPYVHEWGTESLEGGLPLVYGRMWEGLDEPEGTYFEVAQTYVHHLDIHWRPTRKAYCRFDHRGDWEDVVSITSDSSRNGVSLVSFKREPLDQYLVEHDSVLVQLFDFMFKRPGMMPGWGNDTFIHHGMDRGLVFFQQLAEDGSISMARGVQIVRPRLSREQVVKRIRNRERGISEPKNSVAFKVLDFRNGGIAEVSTDPATTTNYFETEGNSLPFDTSPAFFRAEVLAKYKADSERYTVEEGRISCRGGWDLRDYSVNEAGQIAVYICYLRDLPHEEQLHWAIYNECPQAGLSDRAITTDFLGQWAETMTPREKLVAILQRWRELDVEWWEWRLDSSPDRLIVVPRMESRDEWGHALVALSNGVIEGFKTKPLRRALAAEGINADAQWGSIVLLENILRARGVIEDGSTLEFIRELRDGRNFSGVHVTGSNATEYVQKVLQNHGAYAAHFEHLCDGLSKELMLVEKELA